MLTRFASGLFAIALASAAPLYAEKGVPVVSPFPGDAALQYLAPAGPVRQGEVIAVLDCTAIAQELKTAQRELEEVKASAAQAKEKVEVTRAINQEKLENAAEAIADAERALAKYVENDAPGAEVALKLALHDAETEFTRQEERYASRDKLLAEGFIHKVEYDNEETRLKRTRLALEAAKLKMAAFQKYEREAREAQLKQAVKKSKEELAATEKEVVLALENATAALEKEQEKLADLQAQEERLTVRLNQTIIRAGKGGRFTQPATESSPPARGELITNGQVLGHIAD